MPSGGKIEKKTGREGRFTWSVEGETYSEGLFRFRPGLKSLTSGFYGYAGSLLYKTTKGQLYIIVYPWEDCQVQKNTRHPGKKKERIVSASSK